LTQPDDAAGFARRVSVMLDLEDEPIEVVMAAQRPVLELEAHARSGGRTLAHASAAAVQTFADSCGSEPPQ
jgi:hypothetical protein